MINNPEKVVQTTWLAMVSLQAIGSIDATNKLPAPKRFVAITILWSILSLWAGMGYGRAAARFSLALLLTGSVVGPFGQRLATWLSQMADTFAIPPESDHGDPLPGSPSIPSARPR